MMAQAADIDQSASRPHRCVPHRVHWARFASDPAQMLISLFRRAICVSCLILASAAHGPSADNTAHKRQRAQFPLVWEAAKHGPDDAWRRLAPGLESYPLFPYLELASMQRQMAILQRPQVDRFLNAWPGSLPAQTLREAF